jgi:ATP-dependent Lon protease
VHAEDAPETTNDQTPKLAAEYKAVVISILQQRGGWQLIDAVQQVEDASAIADLSGNAPYLDTDQKLALLTTLDVSARLE